MKVIKNLLREIILLLLFPIVHWKIPFFFQEKESFNCPNLLILVQLMIVF
ncbi:MAG: CRISPR-associated protein Cas5 [Bacteroidales bacterium]|nr:CRISPR-associated protein Cas5 [Bacteroidales bacterium]